MTSTATCCIFRNDTPSSLNQDEFNKTLYQAKSRNSEWYEAMVNANIYTFEMSYEESVSYFKHLENFEKIRYTNVPGLDKLTVENEKIVYVTSGIRKSSKDHKVSKTRYHYCDKNNQSTADFTPNDKCKQQNKSFFEAKYTWKEVFGLPFRRN
jgi:hypothetical protein